ncbi:MAG: hypothetical protein KA401_00390 [Anaerolineae bacterium]|nr:hypothetical protein [Chloroflexota bacterium]MBP6297774.1 hypothetical protein [Anaerolineae bacterium]
MNPKINDVLDQHQRKTRKNFSLTGKVVSIIGPRAIVECGGQRYTAILTRGIVRPGDQCTIVRSPGARHWRLSEVFTDPVRGAAMSRQDMFGNGEMTSVAVATTFPVPVNWVATDVGTWKDISDALYITLRRPRVLACAAFEVKNTHTAGRTEYSVRFSVDDDTYFSVESTNHQNYSNATQISVQNTIALPILNLPVGLREATVQMKTTFANSSDTITVRPTSFYLMEF